MEIYICEQYHDNDCGVFSTVEAALVHFDDCRWCENVQEYVLCGSEFKSTDLYIFNWTCSGCGAKWRSDKREPFKLSPAACSPECLETFERKCAEHEAKLQADHSCASRFQGTSSFTVTNVL